MNIFNKIKITKPKRNKFDLSHEKKLSMRMGDLVPIMLEEVVPGDSFKVSSEVFIRLAPMLAPIMHRVNVFTHYFFVPNRLIWDNWKTFITGGEDGLQAPDFPKLQISDGLKARFAEGLLPDYFGVPTIDIGTAMTETLPVSALPFRAYQEIYNEYYRDQNVTPKIAFGKGDGNVSDPDFLNIVTMRKRAWEKDYFTSALPWPQRGADVNLPIDSEYTPTYKTQGEVVNLGGTPNLTIGSVGNDNTGAMTIDSANLVGGNVHNLEPSQPIVNDITINELRTANRLQEWLEKNARGGSRYIEQIMSHFGVRSSDARLQRPEYLGGGKNPVIISEVLNKAGDLDAGTNLQPVGDMAGHGIAVGKSNNFKKYFEEHGHIVGIMSVLPRTTYQQGLSRSFSKFDKLDYYWPEFAHLGEQEVLNQEVFFDPANASNTQTFGYQTRYAEYKYKQSGVHGDFRSSLNFWHMGREFATTPSLNTEFMEANPTERIFAVDDLGDTDKLYCQIYNKVSAIRPMPYFGTPYL